MGDMFLEPVLELAQIQEIRRKMKSGSGMLSLSGCVRTQKAHAIYGIAYDSKKTLVITENDLTVRAMTEDLSFFMPKTLAWPAKDLLFYQADAAGDLLNRQRMKALEGLIEESGQVIVAPASALLERMSGREKVGDLRLDFVCGEETDLDWAKEMLAKRGYERAASVESPGQFAVRGNILDIWPVTDEAPVRIELFGDEIESIRLFDPASQRSVGEAERAVIYPAREDLSKNGTLLDWFPAGEGCTVIIDEPARVEAALKMAEEEYADSMAHRIAGGEIENASDVPDIISADSVIEALSHRRTAAVAALDLRHGSFKAEAELRSGAQSVGSYNNSFERLARDLASYKKKGYKSIVASASTTRAKRLAADLNELGLYAVFTEDRNRKMQPGEIAVVRGQLPQGFLYPEIKTAFISESDIFTERRRTRAKARKKTGDFITDYSQLTYGDYVVHENHGVGIYRGIEQITVDGVSRDYVKLEYKGGNLYVMATQLDVLQKYSGGEEGGKVALNKLGGKEWENTKTQVRRSVKDIAGKLIKLYAARANAKGFAFSKDNDWQREFEELFPYEETEDQLKAIAETKDDMESARVMDRLICGDVGYGKTEVALRAAFKAIQDGKQVAFLVPTTILAQQHYNTIVQRMQHFPVNAAMLCRFRTPAENKKTVEGIKDGSVDIVVGTHRLLSSDVKFKDLGLLVVDEEQRFGVTHKEKIKEMRKDVDVLTLTATPIPRTLHMSLSGIRDMSVLEEPPLDRMPVQTYICGYSEELMREAICREIARGGQVYVVYNNVAGIASQAGRIQELVPEARVAYAHGKMNAAQIEDIMVGFINGGSDVLVSTTIIETGIDIPNVNTMIICDADRFGLSQLYQLRGRVGRTNRTAYAFMMYRKDKLLKEAAEKRLSAIREFTRLGSGFKIAMRDLEIRGAGNLLGAEQHGHMAAVGYDLYCRMLKEAVTEAKGGEVKKDEFETVIELSVPAYLPGAYVPDEAEKLSLYRRIAAIENEEGREELTDELADRFGPLPREARNLLYAALVKAKAHAALIEEVKETSGTVKMKVHGEPDYDPAMMGPLIGSFGGKIRVQAGKGGGFLCSHAGSDDELFDTLAAFFDALEKTRKR